MVDVVYQKGGQDHARRVGRDELLQMVEDPAIVVSFVDLQPVLAVFPTVCEAVDTLNAGGLPWKFQGHRAKCSLGPWRLGLVGYAVFEGCPDCKATGFDNEALRKSWRGLIDLRDVPICDRCGGEGSVPIRKRK